MIKFDHVNKKYQDHIVLNDINLEFLPRQTTVLLGPSGAGKSTLIRAINLLDRPDSGHLIINGRSIDFGQPLSNKTVLAVRRESGMVFQDYNLFPHLSVINNVIEGPVRVLKTPIQDAKQDALELLNKVGLKEKADSYPSMLSGGQQQRVAIARSLAMHPSYVLLDEPTSALDPESELDVLKILMDLSKEGQSLVIVTHNMGFAKAVAHKVVFVEAGKIVFDGSSEAFFASQNSRIADFISAMSFQGLH